MFITIFFHHRTQVIVKFVFVKYVVPINNRFRITFQIMVIVILWKSDKLLSKVLNFMRSDFLLVWISSIKEWVANLKQVVSFIIFSKQKVFEKSIISFSGVKMKSPIAQKFSYLLLNYANASFVRRLMV